MPKSPLQIIPLSASSSETIAKPKRRTFSATDKLRIVTEAEACRGTRGELEAMLRREGIYSSHLSAWSRQLKAQGTEGLTAKKPGRKPLHTATEAHTLALEKRNAELERRLRIANAIIELQKKAHELLGVALPECSDAFSGENSSNS